MKAYFVSTYGDISIEQDEKNEENIILKTTSLTILESELLKKILNKYKDKILNAYMDKEESLENKEFRIKDIKIEEVHKFMKKKLKGNKPILTALKFKDGRLELSEELKKEADKAVTVEKPRKHCPMPTIAESEFRASLVLKEFLNEQQLKDFEKYRQIVCKGSYTGRNYLITSRWSPKVTKFGQVFDLVDKRTICARCEEVAPSEEMLSLKLSIELNEKEFLFN